MKPRLLWTATAIALAVSPAFGQTKKGTPVVSPTYATKAHSSSGEAPVEFLMSTDPEPDPFVTATKSYRAVISGHSNCPGTLVRAEAFQSQPWVRGMLREQLVCLLGGGSNRRW